MRLLLVTILSAAAIVASGCMRQETTDVPDVTGKTLEEALEELDGKPLTPEMVGTCDGVRLNASHDPPEGVEATSCTVIEQVPEPGTTITNFGPVRMTVQ